MRSIHLVIIASLAFVAATPARAEADANTFLQKIEAGDERFMYVLDAYANGISWANTYIADTAGPIYCPPEKVALRPEQTTDIFRRYVERHPKLGTVPAGGVMLYALKDAFPCPVN